VNVDLISNKGLLLLLLLTFSTAVYIVLRH